MINTQKTSFFCCSVFNEDSLVTSQQSLKFTFFMVTSSQDGFLIGFSCLKCTILPL